ncbi:MarR family winged helix-turn-helix transcriptional regulator [Dietzia cinnamea]|uniref:MarR family winged helix-turn-helix transcriptional regulator n=1 Tax=Dietzia cinnamea TaxID=321318 RepID=UPI0021A74FBE|nr:MarR family winged helix-turn-helix transcriptional regulator [Dietzia cinnamea]MCT2274486.1 MarR family winged helix-turn-helix transcriptional regulator [Dietzia cinnamea]
MPDPTDPERAAPDNPGDAPATPDAATLAADLREALRPLWRRLSAHKTLSMGKTGILFRLEQRGYLTATDLAGLERISHQAVANAVRELQDLGLVSRSPDPSDGRRTLLALTEAGRDRLTAERAAGQDWLVDAVAGQLHADERATLAAAIPLLRRLDTGTER